MGYKRIRTQATVSVVALIRCDSPQNGITGISRKQVAGIGPLLLNNSHHEGDIPFTAGASSRVTTSEARSQSPQAGALPTSRQCVRPPKPVRSLDLHFPIFVCTRATDCSPPVSSSVAQSVFNERPNFSAGARITYVMQFE